MPSKSSHIENLLSDLRNTYLAELPSRLDQLDNIILEFGKLENREDCFQNLYRNVHSIKGSAGTHALHILSTICHDFEDRLSLHEIDLSSIKKNEVDSWLKYVDLLRKAHAVLLNQDNDFPSIEHELEELRKSNGKSAIYRCLLVSPTKLQKQICDSILANNNTTIAIATDGYEALGRLLATKYDFLVTNHEISMLNGLALIAATRVGSYSNKDIQAVLLTSNETLTLNRRTDPDYIVVKNSQLAENLSIVVNEIIEHLSYN